MLASRAITHVIHEVDLDIFRHRDLEIGDREGLVGSTRNLGLLLQRSRDAFVLEICQSQCP